MGREIDPRDCQNGWADTEDSEINRLRVRLSEVERERDEALPPFANGDTFWSDLSRKDMYEGIEQLQLRLALLERPVLARHQPCGCVVCICEDEAQCTGCGAHHCGTHPVGEIPNPEYAPHPLKDYADETYRKYVNAANKLHAAEQDRDRLAAEYEMLKKGLHHAHNCKQALAGDNYANVPCTCGADDDMDGMITIFRQQGADSRQHEVDRLTSDLSTCQGALERIVKGFPASYGRALETAKEALAKIGGSDKGAQNADDKD